MLLTQPTASEKTGVKALVSTCKMETKKEKLVSKTSSKVMTIVGIVLCVILLPILIVNLTLIIN